MGKRRGGVFPRLILSEDILKEKAGRDKEGLAGVAVMSGALPILVQDRPKLSHSPSGFVADISIIVQNFRYQERLK